MFFKLNYLYWFVSYLLLHPLGLWFVQESAQVKNKTTATFFLFTLIKFIESICFVF